MILQFIKCSVKDLEELRSISRQTFIDAFEKDNNPRDFKNYITRAFSKDQLSKELLDPNSTFYFLSLNNEIAGYVKLNKNEAQKEQFDPNAIELERIYVLKQFQGRQIGKEAMHKIIELSKAQQASYLWLGVWEVNTRAIKFYEQLGFIKFGKHPYLIGKDEQYDWLMKLDLN